MAGADVQHGNSEVYPMAPDLTPTPPCLHPSFFPQSHVPKLQRILPVWTTIKKNGVSQLEESRYFGLSTADSMTLLIESWVHLHPCLVWHPPVLAGMLWDPNLATMSVKGPGCSGSHTWSQLLCGHSCRSLCPSLDPTEHPHTTVFRHQVLASPASPSECSCPFLRV